MNAQRLDKRQLTANQKELLKVVYAGNRDDNGATEIDLDQLIESLSWQPTKQAIHFSIRALTRRGLLEKNPERVLRRERKRVTFRVTQQALTFLDPRKISGELGSKKAVDNSCSGVSELLKNEADFVVPGLPDDDLLCDFKCKLQVID